MPYEIADAVGGGVLLPTVFALKRRGNRVERALFGGHVAKHVLFGAHVGVGYIFSFQKYASNGIRTIINNYNNMIKPTFRFDLRVNRVFVALVVFDPKAWF